MGGWLRCAPTHQYAGHDWVGRNIVGLLEFD
jgi:hypothetical protein